MSSDQPRVGVATCSTGDLPVEFTISYMELLRSPCIAAYAHVQGSLLPMARNQVLSRLDQEYGLDKLTHILFIDVDMCDFSADHLHQLLSHKLPVVSGLCVVRTEPHKVAAQLYQRSDLTDQLNLALEGKSTKLIPVQSTGAAFLLVETGVLKDIRQDNDIWFDTDRMQRETIHQESEELINLFLNKDFSGKEEMKQALYELIFFGINAHNGTLLIGEDISFSWKIRIKGYKIYLDPSVHIAHLGQRKFTIADTIRSMRMAKGKGKAGNSIPSNKAVGNKEATRGAKSDIKPQKGPSAKTTMKHQNA